MIGVSAYQVPVDLVGVAWQVSDEVEVPEDAGRVPLQVPDAFGSALEILSDLGLLAPAEIHDEAASLYFVHRWTASRVLQRSPVEKIQAAHQRAAHYWRWRVNKIPQTKQQDIEDLLQARYHYKQAGDVDAALQLTDWVCSQLDTWGAYRREEQLYKEVLSWVPERSSETAASVHHLGIIAQNRGDYEQALDWYKKSLLIIEELGNRDGMASSYHQLGNVA